MNKSEYEAGRLDGATEEHSRRISALEAKVEGMGFKIEESVNNLGETIRSQIDKSLQPFHKTIFGNGNHKDSVISTISWHDKLLKGSMKVFGVVLSGVIIYLVTQAIWL